MPEYLANYEGLTYVSRCGPANDYLESFSVEECFNSRDGDEALAFATKRCDELRESKSADKVSLVRLLKISEQIFPK